MTTLALTQLRPMLRPIGGTPPDPLGPPDPSPARPADSTARSSGARLSDLRSIDLDTLVAAGHLQVRVDRKYLVPTADVGPLLAALADRARVLQIDGHRLFSYRTIYFDTADRVSYLAATRRRPRRFKVRTRTYLDSGECWLEAKTKDGRGRTVKTRLPYVLRHSTELVGPAAGFLAGALARETADPTGDVARLAPVLETHYQRATLFLPGDAARVTIDSGFTASEPGAAGLQVRGHVFLETKSGTRASTADRALWRMGHRPVKVSKYATSLAALHPELPAAKWLPALRTLRVVAR